MRTIFVALLITLVSAAAFAQGFGGMGGGKHRHGQEQKKEGKKKLDDKNYKSPLEALPDQKFDPWQNMRGAQPAKGDKSN
jgi:hypothetical protein